MKIAHSTVARLTVTGVLGLDPIDILLQNDAPGKGRITIHCGSNTWSTYWLTMAYNTVSQLFLVCNPDYLAKSLSNIEQSVLASEHDVKTKLKADITRLHNGDKVYMLGLVEQMQVTELQKEDVAFLTNLYGPDWYNALPKVANPEYLHLCQVINAVKQALAKQTTNTAIGGAA